MDIRQVRGLAIIGKGDVPQAVSKEEFLIPSQSDPEKKYKVWHKQAWKCNCPDYQQRGVMCKHIHAVQFWMRMREKAEADVTFDLEKAVFDNDECAYCKSSNIVKNGCKKTQTGNKQRFLCRTCKRTFIADKDMGKVKGNAKSVVMVIDLYLKGVSLRKIQDHLKQFYGMEVHHETIRRWILRFTNRMNDYASQFIPKTGEVWQVDEQMIKARTEHKKGGAAYIWNVLDAETRFLIATQVTDIRSREEARDILVLAHGVAEKPKKVVTDKFAGYGYGMKGTFGETVEHETHKGMAASIQNNRVERYHNTFRERDKTMRGFKSVHTANAYDQAFRLWYNFLRPHMGLNGLTPAQMAGIDLQLGRNRLLELLKLSTHMRQGAENG